jgi:hypothetical protein
LKPGRPGVIIPPDGWEVILVMGHVQKVGALLACLVVFGLSPGEARAESAGAEAGFGILAGVCSLVYAPVKVLYALGGAVVGGFAWVFSAGDNDVARAVVTPAVRGDYVVTPSVLRGDDSLEFIGKDPVLR